MSMLLDWDDFRSAARQRLPRGIFDYIDRGAEAELALPAIAASLARIRFRPLVNTGVETPDLSISLFHRLAGAPLIVAPTALAGLVARDGEIKLARAAARKGLPFTISTQSITPIEEIREGAPSADLWFQLYVWRDRALTHRLLDRVQASGASTLVVTVDTIANPIRRYNLRNGFGMPFRWSPRALLDIACHAGWVARVFAPYLLAGGFPAYGHYPADRRPTLVRPVADEAVALQTRLDWDDMLDLRRHWRGPMIVKGILNVGDARRAADIGMDGIVVSAHGGRNLDCAVTPAEVLPEIVGAVGTRLAVLADSGVRRGSDVLKYLALGASAVMVGRLPLWGLAAADEAGADQILEMLISELRTTMVLLGIARPGEAGALIAAVGDTGTDCLGSPS